MDQRLPGVTARRPAPPRQRPAGPPRIEPVRRPPPPPGYRSPPRRVPPAKIRGEWRKRDTLRVIVALLSAVVLVTTGVGWSLFKDLASGLTRDDVISDGRTYGAQNILLVGVDSRTDAQGNPLPKQVQAELHSGSDQVLNSDTIILLHVPADGQRAVAISIPRDSYVDIPDYRKDKINAAYPASKAVAAEKLSERGITDRREIDVQAATVGRTALVKTVEKLTGVKVDHYAEVNLFGFYNLTNAIGGVEVCLKKPVKERLSGADFPAGHQVISGGAALSFVRQRHELPEGDLSRIRRQQVFLAAVADKILSAGTLTNAGRLRELIDSAKQSVVLDSGWDVFAFARQISALAAGNVEFVTIPIAGAESNSRGDVLLVDRDKVQKFVAERTGEGSQDNGDASQAPSVAPSSIVVDVRNSGGTTGLAAQVADRLASTGYVRGETDNAGSRSTSVVRYRNDSDEAAARQVAQLLGGMPVQQDRSVRTGHVRVQLGTDYSSGAAGVATEAPGAVQSSPGAPRPEARPDQPTPITGDGVPCVD